MKKDKKIWFVRKYYGWGWYPGSWEGVLVLLVYIALIAFIIAQMNLKSHLASDTLIGFVVPVLLITTALIIVCYLRGEKPRWQWGNDRKE